MLDATQINRDPDKSPTAIGERMAKRRNTGATEPDSTTPPTMVRLHNPRSGVQVLVSEAKAACLIRDGAYREGELPA